jgi:hypothetical protein
MAATSITTPSDPPKIQIGEKLKAELWRTIFELGRKYKNTRDIHEKRRIQAQAPASPTIKREWNRSKWLQNTITRGKNGNGF